MYFEISLNRNQKLRIYGRGGMRIIYNKKLNCKIFALFALLFTSSIYAEDYTYDAGAIIGAKNSSGIMYRLGVTISDLKAPSDFAFDTSAGVTSGAPAGINISVSSDLASGTVEYGNNNLPISNFTISMNGKLKPPPGGGGAGAQPTWRANGQGKAQFYIKSNKDNDTKTVTIPVGDSVTFSSLEGTNPKESYWRFASIITQDPVQSITLGSRWAWEENSFTNGIALKSASYSIIAENKDNRNITDSGILEIVQGDFYNNTSVAFDDYTKFTDKTKYYPVGTRYTRGRAPSVYVVKSEGAACTLTLNLNPSPILKDVSIGSFNTKSSVNLTYNTAGTTSATLAGTTLTEATIYQYADIVRNILFVRVKKEGTGTIPNLPDGANIGSVYNQAQVHFLYYDYSQFSYAYPNNDIWDDTARANLKSAFISFCFNRGYNLSPYKHIVFTLFGHENNITIGGRGQELTPYSWIYDTHGAFIVPHEMGHNYGLSHMGDSINGNPPPADSDFDNIMFYAPNNIFLRQPQWTIIRISL